MKKYDVIKIIIYSIFISIFIYSHQPYNNSKKGGLTVLLWHALIILFNFIAFSSARNLNTSIYFVNVYMFHGSILLLHYE